MNTYTAKKIGEVLAFEQIMIETIARGRKALGEAYGPTRIDEVLTKAEEYEDQLETEARNAGVEDAVIEKAEATSNKLRSMQELYIGDEWNNSVELLEWSGFFHGAAVAHASLTKGAAEALNLPELKSLVLGIFQFHHNLLQETNSHLEEKGREKSLL